MFQNFLFGNLKAPAAAITPATIGGVTFWLDGADSSASSMTLSGSNVNTWKDKSATALSGTGSATKATLASSARNGKSAVLFSGASLSTYSFGATPKLVQTNAPFTLYLIFNENGFNTSIQPIISLFSTTNSVLFGMSTNGGYNDLFFGSGGDGLWANWRMVFGVTATTWYKMKITFSGSSPTSIGSFTATVNGVAQTVLAGSAFGANAAQTELGIFTGSNGFNGNMGEVVLLNRVATAGDDTNMNSYFLGKWNL